MRAPDLRSSQALEYRRWYKTARWQAVRAAQLRAEPLCKFCLEIGQYVPATVCDHAEPHKGDPVKFWSAPFQSLCHRCHSGDKQSEEATGKRRRKGVDAEGWPLDRQHHWRA